MGKTSKQEHALAATTKMTAYERNKILRVQKNKEKLLDLGVKNISNSLTSLVESQRTKKRKDKMKVPEERDPEYIPDFNADLEEVAKEESATEAEIPQKVTRRHQHFIPPHSMKRYADLTKKKRVTAPNSRNELHFGMMKENEQDQVVGNTKEGRNSLNGATLTMWQMVLLRKQAQQQKEIFREGSTGLSIDRPTMSNGPRRKLFSVNNQFSGRNDLNFEMEVTQVDREDVNPDDREPDKEVADGEENGDHDLDQIMLQHILEENERSDSASDSSDFDDQNVSTDAEDDELELDEEQLESRQLEIKGNSNEKRRGPTMMHSVHMQDLDNRKVIICNEYGQPVGPVTPEKDMVGELSRFLGTIARNYSCAPLIHRSWHKVPKRDMMWEYILEKYIVPDVAKDWVFKSIGATWRGHKCRVKKKHFYSYKDNKTRWAKRPKDIPDKDFLELLNLWNKKEEKRNEDSNKELLSLAQFFERTRKRTEGKVYADTYDYTAKKIAPEDGTDPADAFLGVMGKEYDGRRRLYGRGVTNKMLKKVDGSGSSSMVSGDYLDSLKASLEVEKNNILDSCFCGEPPYI